MVIHFCVLLEKNGPWNMVIHFLCFVGRKCALEYGNPFFVFCWKKGALEYGNPFFMFRWKKMCPGIWQSIFCVLLEKKEGKRAPVDGICNIFFCFFGKQWALGHHGIFFISLVKLCIWDLYNASKSGNCNMPDV
jgi:hypothetical protein